MKIVSKKLFFILVFFLGALYGSSQTVINYLSDNSLFANPERGFYHHTETHSNNYNSLNTNTLSNYRVNENITLILRVFYLEDFKTSDISNTYLNNIENDLSVVRQAGLKCVVRFAYNNNQTQTDASKAQMLRHLDQLKPIFDEYYDVIAVMQAGFIGSWGEWYYTTQTEFGLPGSAPNYTNRGEVLTKILAVLPVERTVQVRTPTFKREIFSDATALEESEAYNSSFNSRTGHHNDCFLASSTDFGTYGNVNTDKAYLSQECLYVPNGGETCSPSQFSGCVNALSDLSNLHYSYLNTDYNRSVLDVWESDGCMEEVQQKLGYRVRLISAEIPEIVSQGDSLEVQLELINDGWAAPFNARDVEIVLRSSSLDEYKFTISVDPRFWLPNETVNLVPKIKIPNDFTTGDYDLLLNLPDEAPLLKDRAEYSLRLANQGTWEPTTGYNALLAQVSVSEITSITKKQEKHLLYPNPTSGMVIISTSQTFTVANSMGNIVLSGKGTEIDLSDFPVGIYIIQTEEGLNQMIVKE